MKVAKVAGERKSKIHIHKSIHITTDTGEGAKVGTVENIHIKPKEAPADGPAFLAIITDLIHTMNKSQVGLVQKEDQEAIIRYMGENVMARRGGPLLTRDQALLRRNPLLPGVSSVETE